MASLQEPNPTTTTSTYTCQTLITQRKKQCKLTKKHFKYKYSSHPAVKSQNKKTKQKLNGVRKKFEKKLADNIKSDVKSFYAYIRSRSVSRPKPTPLAAVGLVS